jgi:hypothetical protein
VAGVVRVVRVARVTRVNTWLSGPSGLNGLRGWSGWSGRSGQSPGKPWLSVYVNGRVVHSAKGPSLNKPRLGRPLLPLVRPVHGEVVLEVAEPPQANRGPYGQHDTTHAVCHKQ